MSWKQQPEQPRVAHAIASRSVTLVVPDGASGFGGGLYDAKHPLTPDEADALERNPLREAAREARAQW